MLNCLHVFLQLWRHKPELLTCSTYGDTCKPQKFETKIAVSLFLVDQMSVKTMKAAHEQSNIIVSCRRPTSCSVVERVSGKAWFQEAREINSGRDYSCPSNKAYVKVCWKREQERWLYDSTEMIMMPPFPPIPGPGLLPVQRFPRSNTHTHTIWHHCMAI